MNELEKLLNKLIELGYNYWEGKHKLWEIMIDYRIDDDDEYETHIVGLCEGKWWNRVWFKDISLNDLVGIDSGLWQFVVENELFNEKQFYKYIWLEYWTDGDYYQPDKYKYRLMLSSIEADKTQFLLDNIQVK